MSWCMNNRFVRVIVAVALVLTLSTGCARNEPTATSGAPPTLVAIAPTVTPKTAATPFTPPAPVETLGDVRITIVYDNVELDARLKTGWGFAALVEYGGQTLLFDTGADAPTLLDNIRTLGIDPTRIQYVALSHIHDDHVGGLSGLLATGVRPAVYVPPSFPSDRPPRGFRPGRRPSKRRSIPQTRCTPWGCPSAVEPVRHPCRATRGSSILSSAAGIPPSPVSSTHPACSSCRPARESWASRSARVRVRAWASPGGIRLLFGAAGPRQ